MDGTGNTMGVFGEFDHPDVFDTSFIESIS
jgi:hypothetical protein